LQAFIEEWSEGQFAVVSLRVPQLGQPLERTITAEQPAAIPRIRLATRG